MSPFESEWRARFERFARTYRDEASISGWSEMGLKRRLQLFSSLLPSLDLSGGARALDLGCGGGTYVRLLAGLGHPAVGIDYSLASVHRAVAADPGRKGRYLAGEAYALPFRDGAFDLVVAIGVLQALTQPERALDEMARVLRAGGVLVVEALNARAAFALARRATERLRGLPARVRVYDPGQVERWLSDRRLRPLRRLPIHLPPRRLPGLVGGLDVLSRLSGGRRSGLTQLTAHSFLFAARRGQPGSPCER